MRSEKSMPTTYYRVGDTIIHADSYNFMVSDVMFPKEGKNAGREYHSNTTFHPTIQRAVEEMCHRAVIDNIAEFDTILNKLKEIHEQLEEMVYFKYIQPE
jgi:hypothetical protein